MNARALAHSVQVHKAVGHPARTRILLMLRHGELCVCQITAVLQLATSTVSAHLAELRGAGLVEERKTGRWVHYRLTAAGTRAFAPAAEPGLEADPQVVRDRELLRRLVELPLEQLCRPDFCAAALLETGSPEGGEPPPPQETS